jgi:rubrerythrin
MIKQPPKELLEKFAKDYQTISGVKSDNIHSTPIYVCDNCKDENAEAFPYHVNDKTGKYWEHLCNECFEKLDCIVEDSDDFFADDYEPEICPHCGKELEDFSELGCGQCDRRHPSWGME